VFEPFFTTKDVDKGSGLGLSMVYGFVKQSHGHIKIYSEEGHGTTVRIYLPQARGVALPAEQAGEPGLVGGDETILVVEDDNLVRTFVIGQIQSLGYATLAAINAKEAMAVIDGPEKVDLLFTDMIMPGSMNGRQLADAALQQRATLKVLFTSGYSNEAIIHHGHLDAGVLLLAKPYRKSDLAQMIRAALAG
jgi:CheY-like chemotaxis protein